MDKWFELAIDLQDPLVLEELIAHLNFYDAYLVDDNNIQKIYFQEKNLSEINNLIIKFGINHTVTKEVKIENWVQQSEDVWQTIVAGQLEIIPTNNINLTAKKNQILIIPGTGFGTGHHATTRMILEFLQNPLIKDFKPQRICDFGTGSGILAIAAEKLFNCQVIANDNDPLALENAEANLKLNNSGQIQLSLNPLEELAGTFDLITANIYAEVLCGHATQLYNKLKPGGFLILSGIMPKLEQDLLKSFTSFQLIDRGESENWIALLFKKV